MSENLLEDAIAKIKSDIDWRGPSGRVMGHVVLERKLGQALYDWIVDGGLERAAGNDPACSVWKTDAHPSIPDPQKLAEGAEHDSNGTRPPSV